MSSSSRCRFSLTAAMRSMNIPTSNTGSGVVKGLEVLAGGLRSTNTKPLEVRSGQLQVHFIAIAAYVVDLKNRLAARHGYLIGYQWHWWWLNGGWLGGSFLAGFFSHNSVSLFL